MVYCKLAKCGREKTVRLQSDPRDKYRPHRDINSILPRLLAGRVVWMALIGMLAIANPWAMGAERHANVRDHESSDDFRARCADPGVVLCDPLDDGPVMVEGKIFRGPNNTLDSALTGRYRDWRWCMPGPGNTEVSPSADSSMRASGAGSLKFTVPSNSAANTAGYCQINFTPDNSVQFGEGDEFYVQYRVRFSCTLLYVDCDPQSLTYKRERRRFAAKQGRATAFKISIINAGDHPSLKAPVSSCGFLELVLIGTDNGRLIGYHSCGWFSKHAYNFRIHKLTSQSFEDVQPIRRGPNDAVRGCYNIHPITGKPLTGAWHECILLEADEWLTITQKVSVGQWADKINDAVRPSNIKIWLAREGEPPKLVIDFDRNLRRPESPQMKYGKIWLLPYMTDKDPSEIHPTGYIWYDELIVSRLPIPPVRSRH